MPISIADRALVVRAALNVSSNSWEITMLVIRALERAIPAVDWRAGLTATGDVTALEAVARLIELDPYYPVN